MAKRNITVPVLVEIDEDDYELNYGARDDMNDYTREVVIQAATEQLSKLGWARVIREDPPS